MGREVRMVPKEWGHPKDRNGNYIPLLGSSFKEAYALWERRMKAWLDGYIITGLNDDEIEPKSKYSDKITTFEEWYGREPQPENYMPDFDESETTHFQMYEDTSEGTPISPVFDSKEKLARWLYENNASFFGGKPTSYEHWLDICGGGCGLPIFYMKNNQFEIEGD
jgi:hypothetical protein